MEHRIGAQTIVWGEDNKQRREEILRYLSEHGYTGVETGMRHFDSTEAAYYRDLYERFGIEPLGLHSGGTFWDPAQAAEEMEKIGATIEFAASVGFRYLVISGNPQETLESMKQSAEQYGEIGRRCRDAGLQMAYHNHNWELKDDGALIDVLFDGTSAEEVGWVVDIAWAKIAGMDPSRLFSRYVDRISYVHIKDARDETFCELGTGDLDLPEILRLADVNMVEWLVVEQDYTSLSPEESMDVNMRYLREQGGIRT